MRTLIAAALCAAPLVACAALTPRLQRESARAITPTPHPDSVAISNAHYRVGRTSWVATTRDGVYDCSVEGDEKAAICARRTPR